MTKKYTLKKDFLGYKVNQEITKNEAKLLDTSLYNEEDKLSKEEYFIKLINGCNIDKIGNNIYFTRNQNNIMHISLKENIVWVSSTFVGNLFINNYNMEFPEIKDFIKDILSKEYNYFLLTIFIEELD